MQFEELIGVNPWVAVFTLANTIALLLVMKKYLWKPVLDMIGKRQKEIDDMYAEADRAQQQADSLRTQYEKRLSEANDEAERLVKEAMLRGQDRQEQIIRQANTDAAAILDKASADITMEKKKAIRDAKSEISGIALEIAGKVVGQKMDEKLQRELVDHFIDELGDEA